LWEIKPNNPSAILGGQSQLRGYEAFLAYSACFWERGTAADYPPPSVTIPGFSVTTQYAEAGLLVYDIEPDDKLKALGKVAVITAGVARIGSLVAKGIAAGIELDAAEGALGAVLAPF
jgi:hypothetical protein